MEFYEEINFEILVQKEELIERLKHFEIEDLFAIDFEIPVLKSIIYYCDDILDYLLKRKKFILFY